MIDDADASAQRTMLGLGTAAVKNTGTSGANVPLLNANNSFSGVTSFLDGIIISRNGYSYFDLQQFDGPADAKRIEFLQIGGSFIFRLDARRYALFCEDALEDGVRYDQLFAMAFAALFSA